MASDRGSLQEELDLSDTPTDAMLVDLVGGRVMSFVLGTLFWLVRHEVEEKKHA